MRADILVRVLASRGITSVVEPEHTATGAITLEGNLPLFPFGGRDVQYHLEVASFESWVDSERIEDILAHFWHRHVEVDELIADGRRLMAVA